MTKDFTLHFRDTQRSACASAKGFAVRLHVVLATFCGWPAMSGKRQSDSVGPPVATRIASSSLNSWYVFGELKGSIVFIRRESDAVGLYSEGNFGNWLSEKCSCPVESSEGGQSFLALTLEEAFFLSFALGRLFICCKATNLSLEEQWKHFCLLRDSFPHSYAAYHHFRCKGWIPKEGLKYGVQYVLYKKGPKYDHAQYAVIVLPVKDGLRCPKMNWRSMAGLGRLAASVSKTLLLCSVVLSGNINSPGCLRSSGTGVCCLAFSRWASLKEIQDEGDIDLLF